MLATPSCQRCPAAFRGQISAAFCIIAQCCRRRDVGNQSSSGHEHPSILSQLWMDSDDWHCIQIHNSAEHYMRHMHSTVEEADLRISVHVLNCLQAGYTTYVVISNYTDVIDALLFRVPNFLQKGLWELWVPGTGRERHQCPVCALSHMHGWVMITT